MAQFDRTNLISLLLASMTDADSPVSQTLTDKMLYYFEQLLMQLLDTGESGTVTTITETVLTDTGQAWSVDEHNGRTLLITSGSAKGRIYTIDDTTATTITMTGDTLATDGVAINDTFIILYDFIVNTDGHDHDGINSKSVVLADLVVTTAKLADEAVSEAKLGHVMRNVLNDSNSYTNTGLWAVQHTYYMYRQANMDTAYFHFTLNDSGNNFTQVRVAVGGATYTSGTYDTGTHQVSGTLDISGQSTGWIAVVLSLQKTVAGVGTATLLDWTMSVY